ncbi:hypothetical protein EJ077_25465 [Mesorhizobium sp. M8A.F.Ca.ET.057.01.1.1]|nr:hypothetical protein EJ077_25465 [Mesorhizobium sp. M8A.F.Ca.ET.057.01.1.1]RWE49205.1 MAG: hypothetical protein EOS80_04175 [Mesorhizobium sp.]TJX69357.1 MAG: hypothetical protein E5W21_08845 [Mesorhizobium sp.]
MADACEESRARHAAQRQSRNLEVVEGCGEWFVRVIGGGEETICQFDLESFALAYAEGQRLRLKLGAIKRL